MVMVIWKGLFSWVVQHDCVSREGLMGTYGLEGVMRAWEQEKLTTEQAVGQILQLIAAIEKRLRDLERKYSQVDRATPPPPPPPPAPPAPPAQ